MVHCAMSQIWKLLGGLTFVDNTDLCMAGPETIPHTVKLMQQSVMHWEGLLWVTGGALIPEKLVLNQTIMG